MSLAKVVSVTKARKDQGHCGKCKRKLVKGEGYVHFTVGYRGVTQRRCTDKECWPLPSERESSLVSEVYAAQEDADGMISSAQNLEDLQNAVRAVAEACESVASQYQENEMFDRNEDLQQRAETLETAQQEIDAWEPETDEPTEEDDESWTELADSFEEAHQIWLAAAIDSARAVINETELP